MTTHTTTSRAQWLAARLELLEAEKELTRRSDAVARQRQELPWLPVEKEYRFATEAGAASLADALAEISAEYFPTNVFEEVPEIARMDQLVEFTAEIGDLRQAVPAFL